MQKKTINPWLLVMMIFLTAIAARLIGGSDYLVSAVQAAESSASAPLWGTWSNTGALAAARYGHTATRLPNGQVLAAGGLGTSGSLAIAELYTSRVGSSGFLPLLLRDQ